MSGGELDLDAIEARASGVDTWSGMEWQRATVRKVLRDVPALVAEVRRLRAANDALYTAVADYAERDKCCGQCVDEPSPS